MGLRTQRLHHWQSRPGLLAPEPSPFCGYTSGSVHTGEINRVLPIYHVPNISRPKACRKHNHLLPRLEGRLQAIGAAHQFVVDENPDMGTDMPLFGTEIFPDAGMVLR